MFFDKVVVVDDDKRSLDSLQLILQKQCELISFSSAEAALEYMSRPNSVALVIADVFMRGMDGITLLHELKSMNRDLPVIVMTAFGTKEVVIQALQNNADDFIEKPFNIDELKEKVSRFLRQNVQFASVKDQAQNRMRSFVEKNYAHVTLKDLAEDVCLSEKYIGRLFRQKHECNFREFKIQVKIEKAKEMLVSSNCMVQHIARTLGYQNPETFMRIFKRRTGMTPLEYRGVHSSPGGGQPTESGNSTPDPGSSL